MEFSNDFIKNFEIIFHKQPIDFIQDYFSTIQNQIERIPSNEFRKTNLTEKLNEVKNECFTNLYKNKSIIENELIKLDIENPKDCFNLCKNIKRYIFNGSLTFLLENSLRQPGDINFGILISLGDYYSCEFDSKYLDKVLDKTMSLELLKLNSIEIISDETLKLFILSKTLHKLLKEFPDLTRINLNLGELYSNLETLILEDTGTSSIEPFSFKEFKNLKSLKICSDKLKVIENNSFVGLEQLEELVLNSNKISLISATSFNGLQNLKRLDLFNNQLTEILNDQFTNLNNLEELMLGNNKIERLSLFSFKGLSNLKVLNLTQTMLTDLPDDSFIGLENLEKLTLSLNDLKSLTTNSFNGILKLKYLDLSYNHLIGINDGTFEKLSALEELNLSWNKLTKITNQTFNGLINLQVLHLSYYDFSQISNDSFLALRKLKKINFYNNTNSPIPNVFAGIPKFKYQDSFDSDV